MSSIIPRGHTGPIRSIYSVVKNLIVLLVFGTFSFAAGEPNAVIPEHHFPVLEKYCLDCHDADTEKGQVNLEDLSFDLGESIQTAEH